MFFSAALDVNPDHVAGQGVAEPACAAKDAAPQTAEQPAAAAVSESAEELPASAQTAASSPTRVEEATGMPPPSNAIEGEDRAPTPPPVEGREVPMPPRAGASSAAGSPGPIQGPVMPATTTGAMQQAREPGRPLRTRWRKLKVVLVMAANTYMCGANAGTTLSGTRSSLKQKRPPE